MKKSSSSSATSATDRRIAAMIRSEAPEVPADPWFVRKTLHRLPERRSHAGIPELAASVIAVVASLIIIVVELRALATGGTEAFSPLLLFSAAGFLLCFTFAVTMPVLRRCWN